MEDPRVAQASIYGKGRGPPMLYETPSSKPTPRPSKRRKLTPPNPPTEESLRKLKERSRILLADASQLSPGDLPGDFPPELAFRALAAYSLLRTLSITLRLSPFTPNAFLRGLYLPYPNKLIGQVHVALLRILLPPLGYTYKPRGKNTHKRRTIDSIRWPLLGGDNLTYLDGLSWPLFYDDYCHLTADVLWTSYNDDNMHLDFRYEVMQPVGLEKYQYDYAAFDDDEDDDDDYGNADRDEDEDDSETEEPSVPNHLQKTLFPLTKKRKQAPSAPLERGQRVGLKRGYQGMDHLDSDSEFGENDGENINSGSDTDESIRKPKSGRKQINHTQVSGGQGPNRQPSAVGSRVSDVYVASGNAAFNPTPQMVQQAQSYGFNPNQHGGPRPLPSSATTSTTRNPMLAAMDAIRSTTLPSVSAGMPSTIPQQYTAVSSTTTFALPAAPKTLQSSQNAVRAIAAHGWHEIDPHSTSTPLAAQVVNRRRLPIGNHSWGKNTAPNRAQFGHNTSRPTTTADNLRFHTLPSHGVHKKPLGNISQTPPPNIKPRKKPLEVDDDVAKVLNDFLCRKEVQDSNDAKDQDGRRNSKNSANSFKKQREEQQWIHFRPLTELRAGTPYHNLHVEDKIIMLEFLIDQLLSLDVIAAEFAKRKTIDDCHIGPYGAWPSAKDFESLENDDECGICDGEGELLCCDGCVASYHRECLDMTATEQLPEGKWLCPECKLVDPALLGPLRGGRKPSLDWFSVQDIESCLRRNPRTEVNQVTSHNMVAENTSINEMQLSNNLQQAVPEMHKALFDGKIFLVVHGYVFCQPEDRKEAPSSLQVLPRKIVLDILNTLDSTLNKAWPLNQIPTEQSLRNYLLPMESFDPGVYKNRYRMAPVPFLVQGSGTAQTYKLMAMDFESECNQNSAYKLSNALTLDLSLDSIIRRSLRSERLLYDPYNIIKGYLFRLETSFRKACLVDEFWEAGKDSTRQEVWSRNVRHAKSVNRLARLLLCLVDALHMRAFDESWFHNAHLKGSEVAISDPGRVLEDLPPDWSEIMESRKRLWEKTPPESILRLCEKAGLALGCFVQGINEHISKPLKSYRSKRKRLKTEVDMSTKPSTAAGGEAQSPLLPVVKSAKSDKDPSKPSTKLDGYSCSADETYTKTKSFSAQCSTAADNLVNAPNSQHFVDKSENGAMEPYNSRTDNEAVNVEVRLGLNPESTLVDETTAEPSATNKSNNAETAIIPEDVIVDANTQIDGVGIPLTPGPKSNRKRNKQVKKPASTGRRTRRSLSRSTPRTDGPDAQRDAPQTFDLFGKRHITASDNIQTQIEFYRAQKIPRIEKIVKGGFQRQMEWPVCGRMLFATMGNLPPKEMRRLGRNGGVVKAPYVAYQTTHEVGQVCFAHTWRKETEHCHDFERLIHQMRVLESYLDRLTLHSCENVVRRGKAQIQKVIKLSQRDPANGIVEHFVVHKGKRKGNWISSQAIDVSALILESYNRRQEHLDKRNDYLQQKEKVERARKEKEENERKKKAMLDLEKMAKVAEKKPDVSQTMIAQELKEWNRSSSFVLMQHQMDVTMLIKQASSANVPVEQRLEALRQASLFRLKQLAGKFQNLGFANNKVGLLENLLKSSEAEAIKASNAVAKNGGQSATLQMPATVPSHQPKQRQQFHTRNFSPKVNSRPTTEHTPIYKTSQGNTPSLTAEMKSDDFDSLFDSPLEDQQSTAVSFGESLKIPPQDVPRQAIQQNLATNQPPQNVGNNFSAASGMRDLNSGGNCGNTLNQHLNGASRDARQQVFQSFGHGNPMNGGQDVFSGNLLNQQQEHHQQHQYHLHYQQQQLNQQQQHHQQYQHHPHYQQQQQQQQQEQSQQHLIRQLAGAVYGMPQQVGQPPIQQLAASLLQNQGMQQYNQLGSQMGHQAPSETELQRQLRQLQEFQWQQQNQNHFQQRPW